MAVAHQVSYGIAVNNGVDSGWTIVGRSDGIAPEVAAKAVGLTNTGEISTAWAEKFRDGYGYFGCLDDQWAVFAHYYKGLDDSPNLRFVQKDILLIDRQAFTQELACDTELVFRHFPEKRLFTSVGSPEILGPFDIHSGNFDQLRGLRFLRDCNLNRAFLKSLLTLLCDPSSCKATIRWEMPDPQLLTSLLSLLPPLIRLNATFCTCVSSSTGAKARLQVFETGVMLEGVPYVDIQRQIVQNAERIASTVLADRIYERFCSGDEAFLEFYDYLTSSAIPCGDYAHDLRQLYVIAQKIDNFLALLAKIPHQNGLATLYDFKAYLDGYVQYLSDADMSLCSRLLAVTDLRQEKEAEQTVQILCLLSTKYASFVSSVLEILLRTDYEAHFLLDVLGLVPHDDAYDQLRQQVAGFVLNKIETQGNLSALVGYLKRLEEVNGSPVDKVFLFARTQLHGEQSKGSFLDFFASIGTQREYDAVMKNSSFTKYADSTTVQDEIAYMVSVFNLIFKRTLPKYDIIQFSENIPLEILASVWSKILREINFDGKLHPDIYHAIAGIFCIVLTGTRTAEARQKAIHDALPFLVAFKTRVGDKDFWGHLTRFLKNKKPHLFSEMETEMAGEIVKNALNDLVSCKEKVTKGFIEDQVRSICNDRKLLPGDKIARINLLLAAYGGNHEGVWSGVISSLKNKHISEEDVNLVKALFLCSVSAGNGLRHNGNSEGRFSYEPYDYGYDDRIRMNFKKAFEIVYQYNKQLATQLFPVILAVSKALNWKIDVKELFPGYSDYFLNELKRLLADINANVDAGVKLFSYVPEDLNISEAITILTQYEELWEGKGLLGKSRLSSLGEELLKGHKKLKKAR